MQSDANDQNCFLLPDRLENADASDLRDNLLSRRFGPLHVEGCAVRRLGVLAAQVLYAAAAQWRADQQPFRLTASAPLYADLSNLGLLFPELLQEPV